MKTEIKPATYTETFKIRTYETDFKRRITPMALLGYMQELATTHAELLGFGYQESLDHGFYWVLGRSRYELYRCPMLGETIEIKTWPSGVDGICALRRFEFTIGDQVVGIGQNYWLMLDSQRLRPVIPEYFLNITKDLPLRDEDMFRLPKVPTPKDMPVTYEKIMTNTDIDWNNHVNNIRYSAMIVDSMPTTLLENNDIMMMQINFLKETKRGDKVMVSLKEEDQYWHLAGEVEGKKKFTAVMTLKDNRRQ